MFEHVTTVEIKLMLPEDQAEALARFVARADFDDFQRRAEDETEAYTMLHGAGVVRRALKASGFDGA